MLVLNCVEINSANQGETIRQGNSCPRTDHLRTVNWVNPPVYQDWLNRLLVRGSPGSLTLIRFGWMIRDIPVKTRLVQ
jgi:hypothetical protein